MTDKVPKKAWVCSCSQPSSSNACRRRWFLKKSHRSRLSLFAFSGSTIVIMKVCNRTWHHNYILPVKRQCLQQAQGCLYFLPPYTRSLSLCLALSSGSTVLHVMCHLIALEKMLDEEMKKVNCFKLPVTDCVELPYSNKACALCWALGKRD